MKAKTRKINSTSATTKNKIVKEEQLKKAILIGVGLTATGIAGYFGWQYYKKMQAQKQNNKTTFSPSANETIPNYSPTNVTPNSPQENIPNYEPPKTYSTTNTTNDTTTSNTSTPHSSSNLYNPPTPITNGFPLKKGSKGNLVKQLQLALLAKNGKSILPTYGADGDFGKELASALKKLKYPTKITESLFYVITDGQPKNDTIVNAQDNTSPSNSIAKSFIDALSKHNYPTTLQLLKRLKTKESYTEVSNEFKTYRINGGVRQTLVNGVLNTFLDGKQKQAIRLEFIRMGLHYDGKKWSLDGINGFENTMLITTTPTKIWLNKTNIITVQHNIILGKPIANRLGYTLFLNDGKHFLVRSKDTRVC